MIVNRFVKSSSQCDIVSVVSGQSLNTASVRQPKISLR